MRYHIKSFAEIQQNQLDQFDNVLSIAYEMSSIKEIN